MRSFGRSSCVIHFHLLISFTSCSYRAVQQLGGSQARRAQTDQVNVRCECRVARDRQSQLVCAAAVCIDWLRAALLGGLESANTLFIEQKQVKLSCI